jgi:Flp pilus assembly protein protease CpaA
VITLARAAAWTMFAWMWVVFARTDILTEKILNRHVLRSLAGAAALYAALAFWSWRGQGQYLLWGYYGAALGHAALSCAVACALWILGVWPAGDAKLFALLALLLPLLDPLSPLLSWRMILETLIDIFAPASLFVIVQSFHWLWKTRGRKTVDFARQIGVRAWASSRLRSALHGLGLARWRQSLRALRPIAAAGWALDQSAMFATLGVLLTALTLRYGQLWWTGLALCGFSYFGWRGLRSALGPAFSAAALAGCGFAVVRLGLPWAAVGRTTASLAAYGACMGVGMQLVFSSLKGDGSAATVLAALPLVLGVAGPFLQLSTGIVLWAVFLGVGLAAISISMREDTNDRIVKDIKPHMILAPQSLELVRRDEEFYDEHFSTRYPDGMTDAQASALRRWCTERGVERVAMQKTLSFAFWIFLGYFITVGLKRDLLQILLHGF